MSGAEPISRTGTGMGGAEVIMLRPILLAQ